MAKLSKWDKAHQRNLSAYAKKVEQIYDQAAQEAAKLAMLIGELGDKPFEWKDYPQTKERMDKIVNDLYHDLNATIENGINLEWQLSDKKNDELSTTMLGDRLKDLTDAQRKQYFAATAAEASKAFIERKTNGMNLSQNVWNFAKDFKSQLELALDAGIREGKASNRLATQLKQYLKYPDKLFRRVRNEHGQLVLSKRAKVFHPGRGVYRSSYMNARRLAVTETNIAYRTADHERWQQLDFVVGIRIVLSNNHNCKGFKPGTFHDICDELSAPLDYAESDKRGLYPKDFKFTGWHPHCRCHAVPVLKTQEEFLESIGITSEKAEEKIREPKVKASDLVSEYLNSERKEEVARYSPIYDAIEKWKEGQKESKTLIELIENSKYEGTLYRGMSLSRDEYNKLHNALYVEKKQATQIINRDRAITSWTSDKDIATGWYTGGDSNPEKVRVVFQIKNGCFRGHKLDNSYIGNEDSEVVLSKFTKLKATPFGRTIVKDQFGEYVLIKLEVKDSVISSKPVLKKVIKSTNEVTDVPKEFKVWLGENESRLQKATSLPYFLIDNPQYTGITPRMAGAEGFNGTKLGRQATKEAMKYYIDTKPTILSAEQRANIDEIAKIFNTTATPMTFTQADEGRANIEFVKSELHKQNCQSTVVVHEARLRGLNITALPYNNSTKSTQYMLGENTALAWRTVKGKTPTVTSLTGGNDEEVITKLEKHIKAAGRYHIGINLESNRGHIIAAERMVDGNLFFYDTQSGKFLNIREFAAIESIEVLKVDKLLIDPYVIKAIAKMI